MIEGQVSRSVFCPVCAAPAVGARAGRLAEPWAGYWAQGCAHAARPVRMGPKRRGEVLARWARQERERREYIASCAGEPV